MTRLKETTLTPKSPKSPTKYFRKFVVDIDEITNERLKKIREWYRSPSDAHTVRLMIEDIAKGLESGDLISRFRQYPEGMATVPSTAIDNKVIE